MALAAATRRAGTGTGALLRCAGLAAAATAPRAADLRADGAGFGGGLRVMASLGVFPRLEFQTKQPVPSLGNEGLWSWGSFMEKSNMITRIDTQVPVFKPKSGVTGSKSQDLNVNALT